MQDINDIEQLRLQLLANGYSLTRNHDKRTFQKGWPTTVVDAVEVARWARRFSRDRGTGIKVCDGLAVIDLDINDEVMVNRIADRVFEEVPILGDPATPLLVRRGKGFKEAWFVATDETFSRIHSRAWLAPGTVADDGAHRVEIFGGGSPRQFGSFGPHTLSDDGEVLVSYSWVDQSPADVPLDALPVLTKKDFFAVADIVERELEAAGWSIVPRSTAGENEASRVFDLNDEMEFDTNTGEHLTLELLRALAASYPEGTPPLRCAANFIEGPDAKRTDRCIVSLTASGHVAVWESASGVTHVEAAAKPKDYGPEINRIAERLKEIDIKRRNKVAASDGAAVAATKLLETYAFCPYQQLGIVPLYTESEEACMMMAAFRTAMLPNCDEEIGPRGGVTKINPVDIWASSERRITVRGLRMRPDQPRPVYEEGGGKWVNTYAPPLLDAEGGSPDAGVAFLEYLLPNEDERTWFVQWLAHKLRRPWIPGPAVVMVARRQGTGRGTLGGILGRLFGAPYVSTIPFSIFAGKSYQSQYDDWGATSLVVLVSESNEKGSGSAYANKQDTYEHLKEKVEVEFCDRTYVVKGGKMLRAKHCTSYIIATNNPDALPIPAEDRRFGVLANGDPHPDPDFFVKIREWAADDANIAAFARWLGEVDLSDYSPFVAPLMTEAKQAMVDLGGSDIDRGYELAIAALVSQVYTSGQIVALMRAAEHEYDLEYPPQWQVVAKRIAVRQGYRVGVPKGTNWQPMVGGKRCAVYAVSSQVAAHWKSHPGLRDEVLKNGEPGKEGPGSNVVSLVARLKKPNT